MPEVSDPAALALAVDERVRSLPEGCDPARMFGVRLREDGFVLVPFWSGVAREIPDWICPPNGVVAIALDTGGWAAPMDDDGSVRIRPSRHPERRRIHHTALIHGSGEDISVLRYDDDAEPVVLEGAVGIVLDLLVACWSRRPAA
jgi:anti-sigma factor RsiW